MTKFCCNCTYALWFVMGSHNKRFPLKCSRTPKIDFYEFYLADPSISAYYVTTVDNRKEYAKCGPSGLLYKKIKWWERKRNE